jgi:hypothetical protein
MERFFSPQNIEYYRKLLNISTEEPERRLLFELLPGGAGAVHRSEILLLMSVQGQ